MGAPGSNQGKVLPSRDDRDAVNALALHLQGRFEQDEYAPLDADGCTFLTVSHMQRPAARGRCALYG